MNNPVNDTAMELSKMLNFPDLLDIKTNQELSDSDEGELKGKVHQPSHSHQRRSRSHSPRPSKNEHQVEILLCFDYV